jgi:transposase, IS30 family
MPKGYHHVTRDIRSQIYALKSTGTSLHKIATIVERHVSTVSREIQRNTGGRGYRYKQADAKAVERRTNASRTPKKLTPELIAIIETRLREEWSPDQIAGYLKREGGDWVSYETIYKYIWEDKRSGGTLFKHLRHHGKKYKKRTSGKAGRGCIPNRVDIDERPGIVEQKARIGDWEGDTIIGVKHQGAIVSYVDRCSKFTMLKKIDRKTAELVTQATIEKLGQNMLPVLTITYDNGMEFADHSSIASALKTSCYFAKPYHSWERGLNEHTNGLVRQYLPKKTDFTQVSDQTVQLIAEKLNNRPRKSLSYHTPLEIVTMHQNIAASEPQVHDG